MPANSPFVAKMQGDFVRAGDLYYQRGRLDRAAEMYAKAGRYRQAARVSAELHDLEAAVRYFLLADDYRGAGELLASEGDHKAAVPLLEKAEAFWPAAESCLALKQPRRAAKFFLLAEAWERAARCYESCGDFEEALEAWKSLAGVAAEATDVDGSVARRRRDLDMHRVELMEKVGRTEAAADLLRRWGENARAAELLEAAEEFDKAAEAYLESDNPERLARLEEKVEDLRPELRARVLLAAGRHSEAGEQLEELGQLEEAAEAFDRSGEWTRSAEIWQRLEAPQRAADLFFRAEEWSLAADCYRQARRPDLAAEAYLAAGEPQQAAKCFLEQGQPLRAARVLAKAGDRDGASDALQSVSESSPEFPEATLKLVQLLIEEGQIPGAFFRLKMLPKGQKLLGDLALERLYWEARALEAAGKLKEASLRYGKLVAVRRRHRDVTVRLKAVRERLEADTISTSIVTSSSTIPGETTRSTAAGGTTVPEGAAKTSQEGEWLSPGEILDGRYEILEELGRGGMSRVYKAQDRTLQETVAIKTLMPGGKSSDTTDEQRLLREVQIARRITHANVVRIYDIGHVPGGIYVTMELLPGPGLEKIVKSGRQLSLKRVRWLLRGILGGLEAAHARRIVHRDLKPSNVMFAGNAVKLLDFGIARREETDVDLTQTGQVVGSPKYMSPEQVRGKPLDARSDLYSLGVLTYALLAGKEPFVGDNANTILLQQAHDPPPDIRELRADLPAGWIDFLDLLLAKKRKDRFPDSRAVLDALEGLEVQDKA